MVMEPIKGETNVSVKTNFGNLYGSLVIPEKKEKMPLVIIVPGSGPTDRDGNNTLIYGKGFVYRQIAEKLLENGIASLRYDKRGIGASADALIKEEDLRVGYLVQDVSTWITKYKSDGRFSSIIILGHSEGSLIGMLACQKTKVNGFISLAGPGRNMGDIVIDQLDMQGESIKKESREIVRSLKQGKTYPNVSNALAPVFRKEIQPYLVSIMKYNPVMELRLLDIPVLILQGTSDLQISVKDAELLASASNKGELKIIEGMNHMMRTTSKDLEENFKSYGDPDQPLNADFVKELIRFLKKF
jgi:pimeloyl-ACP methyl ester carboxylesterase